LIRHDQMTVASRTRKLKASGLEEAAPLIPALEDRNLSPDPEKSPNACLLAWGHGVPVVVQPVDRVPRTPLPRRHSADVLGPAAMPVSRFSNRPRAPPRRRFPRSATSATARFRCVRCEALRKLNRSHRDNRRDPTLCGAVAMRYMASSHALSG